MRHGRGRARGAPSPVEVAPSGRPPGATGGGAGVGPGGPPRGWGWRRRGPGGVAPGVVITAGLALVLAALHPDLLLADTTPAGGDMGAHVWGPAFLRDHL